MTIGEKIKSARLAHDYTQEELADKIGVKKSCIAKWENGRVSEIKRSNLKALADALEIRPTELLGNESINSDPVGSADVLAQIAEDESSMKMVSEYVTLNRQKKNQVNEYVHLLAESKMK